MKTGIIILPLLIFLFSPTYSSVSNEKITQDRPFGDVVKNPDLFYGKRSGDISLSINGERVNGSFVVKKDSLTSLFVIYSPFGGEVIRLTLERDSLTLIYGEKKLTTAKSEGLKKFLIIGNYPFTIDELIRILCGLPLFSNNNIINNGEIKEVNGKVLINATIGEIYLSYTVLGRKGRHSNLSIAPITGDSWKLKYMEPRKGYFKEVKFVGGMDSGFSIRFDKQ